MRFFVPAFVLGLIAATVSAHAIVIRHDKLDSAYLVSRSKYPFVARISGFAEGTLVGERWVLTASHVAMNLNPINGYAEIEGRRYRVKSIVFHPKGNMNTEKDPVDLAMLYLTEPVQGVTPARLYSRADEVGKNLTFVGAGGTGTGLAEPASQDRKTRAAMNRVEEVTGGHLVFTFDAPPKGLPKEGISGPGDSGGPALLFVKGRPYVLGVSNSNSRNPGQGHCMYGTREYYARVSTYRSWIERTMKGLEAPNWGWAPPVSSLPPSTRATCIQEFLNAFNSADRGQMEAFDKKWRSAEALSRRTPDQRWDVVKSLIATHGTLEKVEFSQSQLGGIAAKFKKRSGFLALSFFFAEGDGGGAWTGADGSTRSAGGSKDVKFVGFTVIDLN